MRVRVRVCVSFKNFNKKIFRKNYLNIFSLSIVYTRLFKSKSEQDVGVKVNLTEDINQYMKDYRKKKPDYFKNYEKCKYYKTKYGLTQAFIDKYGDQSGDIFKLVIQIKRIIEKKPELKDSILHELNDI